MNKLLKLIKNQDLFILLKKVKFNSDFMQVAPKEINKINK